jgi:hypothetical protein
MLTIHGLHPQRAEKENRVERINADKRGLCGRNYEIGGISGK